MKKTLLAATLVGLSAGAFAQGTVAFNNFGSVTPRVYTNLPGGNSGLAAQKSFTVSLYWASASGQALSPIFRQQSPTASDGQFFFSGVTTGNATTPGSTAVFQVYGWTGSATSYADAIAGGALYGASAPFLNSTGGGTITPPALTGWTGNLILTSVPEPTTIALGGLGAAALLLFRRRK